MTFKFLIALPLLILSHVVDATIIDFSMKSGGGTFKDDSFIFTDRGYILEVTGRTWNTESNEYINAQVEWWNHGIGVMGGPGSPGTIDSPLTPFTGRVDADSVFKSDKLVFTLTSIWQNPASFSAMDITFMTRWNSRLEEGDMAPILFKSDGNHVSNTKLWGDDDNQTHFVDVNGEANKMFIWSSQLESDDGFRIESVASDVPEPTTIMVFGIGLIALVFRRKL
jgi:hypothetical protein